MLRKKNRLMRAGQTEKASALALRIGKDIVNRNQTRLSRINSKTSTKDLWAAVRQFTGRPQSTGLVDNVSADSPNQHYASISSDSDYQPPQRKHTAPMERLHQQFASEWQVFSLLDKLSATATGLYQLPAWFLRTGAPAFYKPITRLFNVSIESSIIPHQWKHAVICPVPKIASPHEESHYRLISITPVLSRQTP